MSDATLAVNASFWWNDWKNWGQNLFFRGWRAPVVSAPRSTVIALYDDDFYADELREDGFLGVLPEIPLFPDIAPTSLLDEITRERQSAIEIWDETPKPLNLMPFSQWRDVIPLLDHDVAFVKMAAQQFYVTDQILEPVTPEQPPRTPLEIWQVLSPEPLAQAAQSGDPRRAVARAIRTLEGDAALAQSHATLMLWDSIRAWHAIELANHPSLTEHYRVERDYTARLVATLAWLDNNRLDKTGTSLELPEYLNPLVASLNLLPESVT